MLRFAVMGACALVVAACASVTRGTTETVTFDSEPPGAEMRSVIVDLCAEAGGCSNDTDQRYAGTREVGDRVGPACTTPCTADVKRSDELIATFTKPGFQPATLRIGRRVTPQGVAGVGGNVIAGGVLGMVVDSGTGAGLDHWPNPAKVTLVPIRAPEAPVVRKKR